MVRRIHAAALRTRSEAIETFPLSRIDETEQSSLNGGTIKPVLIPGS